MTKRLFAVSGAKTASLFLGDDSLMFSSQYFSTDQSFLDAWRKKLSLATKVEVKYAAIKSVKKEDNDAAVTLAYKAALGIPGASEFSFHNTADYDLFFDFLQRERSFTRTHAQATPVKATLNYAIGLLVTILFTWFSHHEAIELANGTAEKPTNGKTRAFYSLLEALGANGVLLVGGALACYLLYKIWARFSNPPHQVMLVPSQA